ncbi:sulfatase [Allorhodopirellula heiligendammensis]|uniref:Arylsulfatase n=1 Tax=Allorhodopirellula heiligendammensis TaxID=2714739 RepID=A0A5C6C3R0_9BACT|nr:sulfatase [Allorhodopirellula heiligendammensis]TWU18798.1 Arylsulfatase [Allorhodopirellula heiligendammensis]
MNRIFTLFIYACLASASAHAAERPNVLLISIDDLNDWVGCLGGHPQAETPNIDRLADMGTLFSNAHCQSPVCNPSRASMMTGRYPHTTGIYFLAPDLKQAPVLDGVKTLPEAFAGAGYKTMATGKIFHTGDKRFFQEYQPSGGFGPTPKEKISQPHGHPLWDWGVYPEDDNLMPDMKAAKWAAMQLKSIHDKPFFMGVGFYRPHVPMYAPQKWFDMHPIEKVKLPLVREDDRDDLSQYAIDLTNLMHVSPTHQWVTEANEWEHAVQSYLASVSFADHCLGIVLDALESSEYAENTIVVLFSDHGFHLGEKQRWAKRSLWEDGTRVPVIVSAPGFEKDQRTNQPVELLDVFPTLLELADLPADADQEGQSLVPLMRDPAADWNHPAITSFGRGNFAVRSERYRFIQYLDGSQELYDLANDPHEWTNLASEADYQQIVAELAASIPEKQHAVLPGNSTGHQAYGAANARISK